MLCQKHTVQNAHLKEHFHTIYEKEDDNNKKKNSIAAIKNVRVETFLSNVGIRQLGCDEFCQKQRICDNVEGYKRQI